MPIWFLVDILSIFPGIFLLELGKVIELVQIGGMGISLIILSIESGLSFFSVEGGTAVVLNAFFGRNGSFLFDLP